MQQTDPGLKPSSRRTRQRSLIDEMKRVVLSTASIKLLVPLVPGAHFMQRRFGRSKPVLKGVPLAYRESTRLTNVGSWQRGMMIDTPLSGKELAHPIDPTISLVQSIGIIAALPQRSGIRR
jgi:hypothetical protein